MTKNRNRIEADNDHGEQFPEQMRIAALVKMLLGDVRDLVCQSLDGGSTNRGIRDKMQNVASNPVSLEDTVPSPMDIGTLGDDDDEIGEVGE